MKFKIPKQFQIKGKKWIIIFVEGDHEQLCEGSDVGLYSGSTDELDRIIYIDKALKKDLVELERVVLHEVSHAALFEAHLNEIDSYNPDIEEIICETFSDLVVYVLKKYFYK